MSLRNQCGNVGLALAEAFFPVNFEISKDLGQVSRRGDGNSLGCFGSGQFRQLWRDRQADQFELARLAGRILLLSGISPQ